MEKYGQPTTSCEAKPYKCPVCKDSGYVSFEKEIDGMTYSFSRECECVRAKHAEKLMRASGLGTALEQQTFDRFEEETDMQKRIKYAAVEYLAALDAHGDEPRKPWFYIGGNPGSGKTHICTAICGYLLQHHRSVKYMQWVSEARRMKAYINEPDFDTLVDEYIECDVLYIDDLFKARYMVGQPLTPSDADIKIAFTILNARYLQDKPTIISSEWDMIKDLLPADEGTFSRVYERSKAHILYIPRDAQNNYRLRRVKALHGSCAV